MTRSLVMKTVLVLAMVGVHSLSAQPTTQQTTNSPAAATNPFDSFVGTWEGKCQDDRTFVVLDLKASGNQLEGTVSIGNMHGDDQGACRLVLNPPVPEHAQKIEDAVANNKILSFKGPKHAEGTSARFELKLTGPNQAQLKLMNTPVADHPWQLVKTQKAE